MAWAMASYFWMLPELARAAPAPTDNGTPSATVIRSCHSELDAGCHMERPQRAGSPTLPHLRMLVARQGWLAAQDLAAASFGKSRSATVSGADSARRRVFLIGVGETPRGDRSATGEPPRGPARVLGLLDRPRVVAPVNLTPSPCACAIR